jgi:uncharacterized UPF0160 family protein
MKIATHNGIFHADDVFACAILKSLHPNAEIVRTRNPELLVQADIRVDVGGKSNPATGDYDHHHDVTLQASCNLVWFAYWEEFLNVVHGESALTEVNTPYVMAYVKNTLLDPISGLDCNFTKYSEENPIGVYKTVGQAIMDFNRIEMGEEIQLFQFNQAVEFARQILKNCTYNAIQREQKIQVIRSAQEIGEFGLLLSEAISYNEFRNEIPATRKLLVFPDSTEGWCVMSLDVQDFNLSSATSEGLIFAHKIGFFTKWQTQEQAIEFAAKISESKSKQIDQWSIEQNGGNGARC